VDDRIPADELPHLYRALLDAVGRLEHAGQRELAWRIRRDAIRVYSVRWDVKGRRCLQRLHSEAVARLAASPRAADHRALSPRTRPA
jgi:hypothetical protein